MTTETKPQAISLEDQIAGLMAAGPRLVAGFAYVKSATGKSDPDEEMIMERFRAAIRMLRAEANKNGSKPTNKR